MSTLTGRTAVLALAALLGLGACGPGGAVAQGVRIGSPAPGIAGGPWINSGPLTLGGLGGRVVLVEFWTYG